MTEKKKIKKLEDGTYNVLSSNGDKYYNVSFDEQGKDKCECKANVMNGTICRHIKDVKAFMSKTDINGNEIEIKNSNGRQYTGLDPRFIVKVSGRDFVIYAGLLDLAHQKGIKTMIVSVEQFPNDENGQTAICRATMTTENGDLYEDYGDASPKNVGKLISAHILRMASTRAKARVLRDFTNVGMTCLEEIGDTPKMPTNKQLENLLDKLKKFSGNFSNDQKREIHKWITGLTRDELLLVDEKISTYDTFDYSGYVTLKKETEEYFNE